MIMFLIWGLKPNGFLTGVNLAKAGVLESYFYMFYEKSFP